MTTEKALELVKKLFALADSDNEHEAQDALIKAQGIMLKYHLSGSIEPSSPDFELTRRLLEVCKLMGITLIDHMIVKIKSSFCL